VFGNGENMNKAEILDELIKSRKTIRRYKSDKLPFDSIEKMLESSRYAPSAHNIQPWKFVVISDEKLVSNIYEIMIEKEKKLLAGFNVVMKETAKCLIGCPCLIVAYTDNSIAKKFSRFGEPYKKIANIYEVQSVSFALYNIILSAHAAGIGSACLGMALFCESEINKLLNQNWKMQALLSLGFPNEIPVTKERKPLSEIVTYL